MTPLATTLDPITFEVVKHRLWQITDEQAATIKTISASPIVVEGNDFNVGVFTADGRVASAGIGSLVHVTTMGSTIENLIADFDDMADGDAFMTNDPFRGALHQNDVVVAAPVFRDGEIVLWVANVLHHPDVGGIDEGSFCINARNLYQEPPRYCLKLISRGRVNRDVERTFVTNSRLPDAVALDLRAQIGAINVAQRRLGELIDEYGLSTVLAAMEQSLELAELALRERLRELPEGAWEADAYMDGDRVGSDTILRVHVRLEKRDDQLIFDYAGSDRQVEAAVNSTYHATYAGSVVPVYTFICGGDIDWNDAVKSCVRVIAEPGTVVNAQFPAPVSICTIGFRWLVTVAASKAVAEMLSVASGAHRERVCASWSVSANCNNVFATLPDGRRVGALLSDHRAGGAGGRSFADGFSHAGQATSYSSNVANVESVEWKLPVMYLYRRQMADSGGPGQFRGGLTAESALVPWGVDSLLLKSTNTAGTDQSNAHGADGGYPGAGSQVVVARGTGARAAFDARQPLDLDLPDSQRTFLPSKAEAVLGPDDALLFHPPGGGGYGDPLDREPTAVLRDLRFGRLTADGARQFYGVVINDEDVDEDATHSERTRRREQRLGEASDDSDPAGATRRCPRCETARRPMIRIQPLAAAGPWLAERWRGHSPNFVLEESICSLCGQLLEVREVRQGHAP